jgi:hypothetical protein
MYLVGVVALGALSLEDLCTLLDVARGDGNVRLRDPHGNFLAISLLGLLRLMGCSPLVPVQITSKFLRTRLEINQN